MEHEFPEADCEQLMRDALYCAVSDLLQPVLGGSEPTTVYPSVSGVDAGQLSYAAADQGYAFPTRRSTGGTLHILLSDVGACVLVVTSLDRLIQVDFRDVPTLAQNFKRHSLSVGYLAQIGWTSPLFAEQVWPHISIRPQ